MCRLLWGWESLACTAACTACRKEYFIETGQRHYYFMNVGNGEVIDASRRVGGGSSRRAPHEQAAGAPHSSTAWAAAAAAEAAVGGGVHRAPPRHRISC